MVIRVLESTDVTGLAAYCETMRSMDSSYADISPDMLQSLFSRYWRLRLYLADLSDGQLACGIKGDRTRAENAQVIHLGLRSAAMSTGVLDEAVEATREACLEYARTYPDVQSFFGHVNWLDRPGADQLFDTLADAPWITVEPVEGIRGRYSTTVEAISDAPV